ncbi:hypothetical protein IJJ27_01500 [bacterium]|nr:hypothetical protein [bacterium]
MNLKIAMAIISIFALSSAISPQLTGQFLADNFQAQATTAPLSNIQIGDHVSLGGEQFIKLNDTGLLMMSSTLTCPHGKRIAGQWVKCFECPTGSTYDSTNVTCTCTNNSYVYDINTSNCLFDMSNLPSDYDSTNCSNPIALMNDWHDCSSLATHATVCLADPRDYRTYRVRKLADGQCWMVDSLKFGGNYGDTDGCAANSGAGNFSNGGSSDATKAQETFVTGYYGHCRAITGTYSDYYYNDTRAYNNYLYDWVAAMQSTLAYYGSSTTFTPPHQGICPTGWHLPTGNTSGEFGNLYYTAYNEDGLAFLDATKGNFALSGGVYGGNGSLYSQGLDGSYWSSSAYDISGAYGLYVDYDRGGASPGGDWNKRGGLAVRCVQD